MTLLEQREDPRLGPLGKAEQRDTVQVSCSYRLLFPCLHLVLCHTELTCHLPAAGQAISGATIGVAGLSVGNSGIHSGHRAALAKQDAERAAKEKPAPVVEEPVVKKEVVHEPIVAQQPVVAQQPRTVPVQSEFVHTTPIQPITQSAISDIPTEIPAGVRLGHSTIISGAPYFWLAILLIIRTHPP